MLRIMTRSDCLFPGRKIKIYQRDTQDPVGFMTSILSRTKGRLLKIDYANIKMDENGTETKLHVHGPHVLKAVGLSAVRECNWILDMGDGVAPPKCPEPELSDPNNPHRFEFFVAGPRLIELLPYVRGMYNGTLYGIPRDADYEDWKEDNKRYYSLESPLREDGLLQFALEDIDSAFWVVSVRSEKIARNLGRKFRSVELLTGNGIL